MNEFIEQFLIEARELVDQATNDLLALESDPQDQARLDDAFRAFHTLKGSAGIVDFDAMGRALHVAEDVLAALRTGGQPVTAALVSDCLTCLDQIVQWLDQIEEAGEPPPDADAAADAVIARFQREAHSAPGGATNHDWAFGLLVEHSELADQARTAIRFQPAPDCFYRGLDPIAIIQTLPGLLALKLDPQTPWPTLDLFDPTLSQLIITALSTAPADDLAPWAETVGAEIEAVGAPNLRPTSTVARALLEAQIVLLGETIADGLDARTRSAARTSANVLRAIGRPQDAASIDGAMGALDSRQLAGLLARLLDEPAEGPVPAATDRPAEATARTLRVEVERIDALVRLAGELTIVKNALGHVAALARDGSDPKRLALALSEQHGQLERLVADLQRSVLSVRVLPLRQVFQRFPRTVREAAATLGKPVRLITQGEETEADKTVVEGLFEPLLHIVRNALDHGVEQPALRQAAGKPAVATLILRGERRGNQVVVELEDDGGGIDVDRVRSVAARRGLASEEALAAMSDAAAIDLIFAPGFSTASEVTDLSGRGVGMDAVRRAIEKLGGRVEVVSTPGKGALVRLLLPFTMVMTQVMTVEAGGQVFGAPLDAVVETVKAPREAISAIGQARAFVWRNRTIPLIGLGQMLGVASDVAEPNDVTIMIVRVAGERVGLEVDRIGERMDIMLKPLDGLLAGARGVAGTTLTGDGRVLIVLDLAELNQ